MIPKVKCLVLEERVFPYRFNLNESIDKKIKMVRVIDSKSIFFKTELPLYRRSEMKIEIGSEIDCTIVIIGPDKKRGGIRFATPAEEFS